MKKLRKMIITRGDLLEFMGKEQYENFLMRLAARSRYKDYEDIKPKQVIWIVVEW